MLSVSPFHSSVVAVVAVIAALLVGCSGTGTGGNPTEADGQKAFEKILEKQIKAGEVKIRSFRKTDGQSLEKDGVKQYAMMWEIELEYLANSSGYFSYGEKGQVKKYASDLYPRLEFERTEKGWRDHLGNIY